MNTKSFNIGLCRFSMEFYKAASELRGAEEELSPTPVYYLYSHSIELAMKAYLVTKGHSEEQLRKIGHDLKETWDEAKALNITDHLKNPQQVEETVYMISPYYEAKELEYIAEGYKRLPRIIHMHNSAEQLLDGVNQLIHCHITT